MAVGDYDVLPFAGPTGLPVRPEAVRGNDETLRQNFVAHQDDVVAHVQSGTAAERPASGTEAGEVWIALDTLSISVWDGDSWETLANLVGPGSSTDHAVARWDGATGRLLQNSVVIVTDAGVVTGVASMEVGLSPPITATDALVTVTKDGATSIQLVGYGNTAGVRNLMASGTRAAPTAISVAGVLYLGFLGGTGYDGTTWQTVSAGLFGVKPDGTWSGTSRPALLTFETTSAASTTRVRRWDVTSDGHFLAFADNTYDIGAAGATRPRTGYFGTSVVLAHTSPPGAPTDGEIWTEATGIFLRLNGVTRELQLVPLDEDFLVTEDN
jgi:hypothetical protein